MFDTQRSEPHNSHINASGEHVEVVHSTLNALVDDVNKTTDIIRKCHEQQIIDKRSFYSEMEVNGRVSVEPQEDWLTLRLKSISTEDIKQELTKVKTDQRQNAVVDTLAALVYDVNATAEVLKRKSFKEKKPKSYEEIEYRLRLTPAPDDQVLYHHEDNQLSEPIDESYTIDNVKNNYGIDLSESQTSSLKRTRPRSSTPRRTINIDNSISNEPISVCAYCSEEIDGATLTALAPNSVYARKFHPHHFMCCYCLKALNLRGTYREHNLRPYCHECFYKLYNGLLYEPDLNQTKFEKLI